MGCRRCCTTTHTFAGQQHVRRQCVPLFVQQHVRSEHVLLFVQQHLRSEHVLLFVPQHLHSQCVPLFEQQHVRRQCVPLFVQQHLHSAAENAVAWLIECEHDWGAGAATREWMHAPAGQQHLHSVAVGATAWLQGGGVGGQAIQTGHGYAARVAALPQVYRNCSHVVLLVRLLLLLLLLLCDGMEARGLQGLRVGEGAAAVVGLLLGLLHCIISGRARYQGRWLLLLVMKMLIPLVILQAGVCGLQLLLLLLCKLQLHLQVPRVWTMHRSSGVYGTLNSNFSHCKRQICALMYIPTHMVQVRAHIHGSTPF